MTVAGRTVVTPGEYMNISLPEAVMISITVNLFLFPAIINYYFGEYIRIA